MAVSDDVKKFALTPEAFIIDGSPILYLNDIKALVFADFHLGIESIMADDGSFSLKKQTYNMTEQVIHYIQELKPKIIILNGDIKHSFSEPTKFENREVKYFLQKIGPHVKSIEIVKGNHDVLLNWATRDIPNCNIYDEYFNGQYFFVHGHKLLPKNLPKQVEFVIIGHEHPVFSAKVHQLQKIQQKTFLLGPLKNCSANLIVSPAISRYSIGMPINPNNQDALLSPILREQVDLKQFEAFVLGGDKEIFHFPKFIRWYPK